MKPLSTYTKEALARAHRASPPASEDHDDLADSSIINSILGRDLRRIHGIFFSGERWASKLLAHVDFSSVQRVIDPSCGIGDLLVEAARLFKHAEGNAQLDQDELKRSFVAFDLFEDFISITWARIIRTYGFKLDAQDTHEQQVKPYDSLTFDWGLRTGDLLVMNPPFHKERSPTWSEISNGTTSCAALFLEKALLESPPGVCIAAILPEVIRSGTRYERLRRNLSTRCEVALFKAAGAFGGDADIDVALLVATTRPLPAPTEPTTEQSETLVIGDLCKVSVGSVVPHRDKEAGKLMPYIDVRSTPAWSTFEPVTFARYSSRTISPPFVVVRRTSSPSDRERARASIVTGGIPVLVENHLIVLEPNVRTLNECKKILGSLKDCRTSDWLNDAIRCRHLTVSSVKGIPVYD
ncbi:TPA: hypothetical protein QEF96_001877 [Stenotrophomonas maltophilia]|uniref:hypothetical protein n=1 Tax=Stenotrophomonas maltophilia TaxID=40324 RepID=UPI001131A73A|nr:hypothetical protein [Stenotrophomonas maltophilia]MPS42624.1 hypothetical protein [Stenotrophomonas sp.]QPX93985.1 hypothetical protein HUZ96_14440 [Stenotrophomonas maltophilia]HDS1223184.1 hypothetical protein [Stenotrophomonas maltophilia]